MKHLTPIIIVAAAAAVLSGCSVMKKNKNTAASAPQQTEQTAESKTKPAAGISTEMLSGEWTIMKVKGQDVPQEDRMPYINFDVSTGRFYASNGCNTINGSFSLKGSKLQFSQVASTLMLCDNIPFEHEISVLLGGEAAPSVAIRNVGHESYLSLTDNATGLSLEARRHNMEFLNGQWRIAQINGKDINDEEANIFIDLGEMKVHGNTGCNFFNGEIYIDPAKSNSVEFGKMGLTRMACPKYNQEQAMMLALEETTSAIRGNNNRVMLLKADGTPVIVLEKQDVK